MVAHLSVTNVIEHKQFMLHLATGLGKSRVIYCIILGIAYFFKNENLTIALYFANEQLMKRDREIIKN